MGNDGLAERLGKAEPKSPLTGKEREKAVERFEDLKIKIEANNIRINVLQRLMNEEDIYFDGIISKRDYEQIDQEWEEIYEILSKNSMKKIRLLIENERINSPDNYLSIVQDKMIARGLNIQKFFTFNRYLNRRRYNLNGDHIEFIKNLALKNEAYEFLDALKEDN